MAARRAQQLPVARVVGENVARLRAWYGWSLLQLQGKTERYGHRIGGNELAEMEHGVNRYGGPRMVTVDQLVVLARALRVTPADLMTPGYQPRAMCKPSTSTREP